ncbi:tRNA epoxyqueuosine(34) reductase QueG [Bermanella marisrubri]|uniref:Epoxyqueuosine reductase n=1 Tax=Bermanella marisrubri TaxID=207949 RepID=Q1N267_9GAMM|nr:tRNA epoxyqueuosine(34) reductase QueG [Bermanella marisrubri]EAT12297.1 iron-sulfur cluster binding protein, putative [Bermanella marisrubri]
MPSLYLLNPCTTNLMTQTPDSISNIDWHQLTAQIKQWAYELGFAQVGITDVNMEQHAKALKDWLAKGYHGEMSYMADHGNKRYTPDALVPGTLRIISVRMNYMPEDVQTLEILDHPSKAYISRYALGRDYHKLIRKRLTQLGKRIESLFSQLSNDVAYRAFVDSAPVLERGIAQKAGLGWIGKNAMLINPKAGSYFFLGELFTNLPLIMDEPYDDMNCGSCTACFAACPTDAIVDNHVVDARKCISYLTIELKSSIPTELRSKIGNRIFGCDDCQLCCPWTKFTDNTQETDFTPRHQLDDVELLELFHWDESTFLQKTEGMPLRRSGFELWQRNIAVALGNAAQSEHIIQALEEKRANSTEMVQEHIDWAIEQQIAKRKQ